MKFLALLATASALTLKTEEISNKDIVEWFLKEAGSSENFMSLLDKNNNGKVSLSEVKQYFKSMGGTKE